MLIAVALLLLNTLASEIAVLTGLSTAPNGILGDLVLIEVGLLAIVGGAVEFHRSKGAYEFRRLALHSKESFSSAGHAEASRNAVAFFVAALVLFLILAALVLL